MHFFYRTKNSDLCLVVNKNDNFKDSNLVTFNKDKIITKFYLYPHQNIPKNYLRMYKDRDQVDSPILSADYQYEKVFSSISYPINCSKSKSHLQ